MRAFFHKTNCAVALALALSCSAADATGLSLIQSTLGLASDPLKVGQLGASAERTAIQLRALEGQTNYDVQQRLEQIRTIVREAIAGTQATIADATNRMLALEAAVNEDAIRLIYRAQCAAEVVLMNQLQRGFAELIHNLKEADPSVTILGVKTVGLSVNDVKIEDPDKAYQSTKAAALAQLAKQVNDNSKAYNIISAYQNLERAARFVRCHYIDQAFGAYFVGQVNELERISLPWVTIVSPVM